MAHLLYFGDSSPSSTSEHRARALERLGHTVALHDPDQALASSPGFRYASPIHYRTGYRFVQARLARWVKQLLRQLPTPPRCGVGEQRRAAGRAGTPTAARAGLPAYSLQQR